MSIRRAICLGLEIRNKQSGLNLKNRADETSIRGLVHGFLPYRYLKSKRPLQTKY